MPAAAEEQPNLTQILKDGHTFLMLACLRNLPLVSEQILTLLAEFLANEQEQFAGYLNWQDDLGRTALFHACQTGNLGIVTQIVSYDSVDASLQDYVNHDSCLTIATKQGHQ